MGNFLAISGHTCRIFKDGENLIAALPSGHFDLFVLDWHVPILNGFEVLKRLRGQFKVTKPIIFLTSMSDDTQMAKALNMGANDYCVKPVQLHHFIQRLSVISAGDDEQHISASMTVCGYRFDPDTNTVYFDSRSAALIERDFLVAQTLFRYIDRPVSRGYLLSSICGASDFNASKELDQHIFRIKQLLNLGVNNQSLRLTSITGFGFRLNRIFMDN
jgi:DNA-binding response OmpR family regulator